MVIEAELEFLKHTILYIFKRKNADRSDALSLSVLQNNHAVCNTDSLTSV